MTSIAAIEPTEPSPDEAAAVAALAGDYRRLRDEIGKVIVGQEDVVDQLLIGLFARGHVLLVGVPGLAKTLLVSTVSRILSLSFRRIQFTPDMMPSDITGTDILQDDPETGRRRASPSSPARCSPTSSSPTRSTGPRPRPRPRSWKRCRSGTSPPATGRIELPDPFFVLATQNPIEQEGTYPLPEAQLDRFMLNVRVPYPTAAEELEILRQTTGDRAPEPTVTLSAERIVALQAPGPPGPGARARLHPRPRRRPRHPPQRARGDPAGQEVRRLGRGPLGRARP